MFETEKHTFSSSKHNAPPSSWTSPRRSVPYLAADLCTNLCDVTWSVIHTYDVTSCYLWHRSWYNLFIDPMKFDSCFDSFLSWSHEVILYDAFLIQWSEFNDFNDCGVISFFVKIWTFFKCLERNQYSVLLVGRTFVTYWSLMIAYDHLRRLVSE